MAARRCASEIMKLDYFRPLALFLVLASVGAVVLVTATSLQRAPDLLQ